MLTLNAGSSSQKSRLYEVSGTLKRYESGHGVLDSLCPSKGYASVPRL